MNLGLAIVGHGKMGRLIEQLAPEYNFDVRAKFRSGDNAHGDGLTSESLRGVDVAIEFSTPETAVANLRRLSSLHVNTVTGTTGWLQQLPAVREAVAEGKSALVWSANFSVGMNLFLQAVAQAAALFARHPEYEAWGWEIHHSQKKDSQSGTLKKLGQEMLAAGYDRPCTSVRTAPEPIPALTKLDLIPLPIPSRCATRRAVAKDLRVGRCKRRGGSWAKKVSLSSERFSANSVERPASGLSSQSRVNLRRSNKCLPDAERRWLLHFG
jgi:4-hydroxy-tetrahydrodipicolinate reductase